MTGSVLKEIKNTLYELREPLVDFYLIRKPSEKFFFYLVPMIIGCLFPISTYFLKTVMPYDASDFLDDLLGQLITMLTLFISFSMAYLSIIVTSSSRNIDAIKNKVSDVYKLRKTGITLYQNLISEITYNLFVEIMFLLFIFLQKFLILISNGVFLKIYITLNVILLVHVLIIMMVTVKNIYFTFWKSK